MQTACYPCRQLNSKTIRSAALCYLSPVFWGKCSIISAKCVCKVEEDGFEKAWNNVCRTRDACDSALKGMKNVAFFFEFRAIATQRLKKRTGNQKPNEDHEDSRYDPLYYVLSIKPT
ncbi:uncharacterized protein LOC114953558 [Acropora millepora]|uniref:uncharacterized protein LOC114953558 n=1 Tax=Acropora millepora TaxID=45264 RepID=UPI001CF4F34A|nr:uncharacterized protein LOC114953558 [Acropora millepora]